MVYLFSLLVLVFLIFLIAVQPRLFIINNQSKVGRQTKINAVVSVLALILSYSTIFFFSPFQETNSFFLGTGLLMILLLCVYSFTILIIKSKDVVKSYNLLHEVKHGKKEDLLKEKQLLENEKKEFQRLRNQVGDDVIKLEQLERVLNSKETNLNATELKMRQSIESQYQENFLKEKTRLQEDYNSRLAEYTQKLTKQMESRLASEKLSIVDNIFTFDGQARDDSFEIHKEKESISKSKLLLEMEERLMSAKQYELNAKRSALEVQKENAEIKADMKVMSSNFKLELFKEQSERLRSYDQLLHRLELESEKRQSQGRDIEHQIRLMEESNKIKYLELKHYFENELKNVQMETIETFRGVSESISDMKLQFGQEILRIDGQQDKILVELEKYYLKSREYVHQCQSLALEARNQNIEGQKLMNHVDTLYKQHKLETGDMEKRLDLSLSKIAVKEGEIANRLGETFLNIQNANLNNSYALKNIALERQGIEVAAQVKYKEQAMALQELKHQRKDLQRQNELYEIEELNDREQRRSNLAQDKLYYQLERDKQRYVHNLERAQRSQVYLNKIS